MTGYQNFSNTERYTAVSRYTAAAKREDSLSERIIDFFCLIVLWLERPSVKTALAVLTAVAACVAAFFVLGGLLNGTMPVLRGLLIGAVTAAVTVAVFRWAE